MTFPPEPIIAEPNGGEPKDGPEEPTGYSDAHETVARMNQLIRLAVQRHKRAGVPICGWKDGRLVIIQPEDIPEYPDEPDEICEMPLSSSIDNR